MFAVIDLLKILTIILIVFVHKVNHRLSVMEKVYVFVALQLIKIIWFVYAHQTANIVHKRKPVFAIKKIM